MLAKNFLSWCPDGAHWSLTARYAVAVAACAIALTVRHALLDVLPQGRSPFVAFYPAVLLVGYMVGIGPGLVAALLSLLGAWYFFLDPPASFQVLSSPDAFALTFNAVVLVINAVVAAQLRQAVRRAAMAEALLGGGAEASRQLRLHEAVARARRGETVRYGEEFRQSGGGSIAVDFEVAPLRGKRGEVVALVVTGDSVVPPDAAPRAPSSPASARG